MSRAKEGDRKMSEEKIDSILQAMQGITYLEWKKLSHAIDKFFESEASKQSNKIELATPEKAKKFYNLL